MECGVLVGERKDEAMSELREAIKEYVETLEHDASTRRSLADAYSPRQHAHIRDTAMANAWEEVAGELIAKLDYFEH